MFTKNSYSYMDNGIRYTMEVLDDENIGYPWVEHDGHGVCVQNGWLRTSDRYVHLIHDWYYDRMSSLERAKEQGWGPGTPEQAVERDLEHLLGYCKGKWRFVGVSVKAMFLVNIIALDSLWGIESSDRDYLISTGNDLAVGVKEAVVRYATDLATCAGVIKPKKKTA